MGQVMSTAENTNLLMAYFDRKAMATLHEELFMYQLAEKRPLPKGSGTTITFNSWNKFAAPSAVLSQFAASANGAVVLSSRKVAATIGSYGRAIQIGDLLEMTSILPVEPGALKELEHSAALAVDNVVQLAAFKNSLAQVGQNSGAKAILSSHIKHSASSFCANTGTLSASTLQFGFPAVFGTSAATLSAVSPTAPSVSAKLGPIAVRKAVARLKKFAVPPMDGGSYLAVAHPYAIATLMSNPDYKQWTLNYKEGPEETMFKHEVTKVHNVRFLESQNAPRYVGANLSVNITLIVGMGALAVTELDGGVKMIIKRPGEQSTNDPYNLVSTLSYKYRGVAAVLNPSAGVCLFTSEKF